MEITIKPMDRFISTCYDYYNNKIQRGLFMDYKSKIIAMIKELDNTKDEKFLLQIFTMIKRHICKE
jgi:hypothetical protein